MMHRKLALTLWLALLASICITAPSSAKKSDVAALSAKILETECRLGGAVGL